MAIYSLAAQEFSRGAGHSAVHAAAYRGRCELVDERTGLRHDYSRKSSELLFEGIYAPKDAPAWAHDRQQLWNHVEAFEKHRRAILAREFIIALPHELTLEQNRYALQDWIRDNFTRKGLIADVTIHKPDKFGDQRNIHAHVMAVTRKLDGREFIRSKERFDTYSEKDAARKAELVGLRESWARIGNRHLERHGFEPTLDHRTLDAQGIEREPTIHMGKAATAIEREGKEPSELGDVNREIKAENEKRVIDLAAERAMREARDAARGQVDNIRPENSTSRSPQHYAELRAARSPEPPPKVPQKFTREAVQRRESTAAPSLSGPWGMRTTEARSGVAVETGKVERATEKAAGKASGIFARGIFGVLAGVFKWLDLFPAAPPSPEQQERNHRAAEEQQATDEIAAKREEIHERQRREQNQRRQEREIYIRPRTRPVEPERDDDRGRERER